MGKPEKSPLTGFAQAFALVTELGFGIGLPIVAGALLGNYLDQRYSGRGLIFIGVFLLGLAAGLYNGYRLLRNAVTRFK